MCVNERQVNGTVKMQGEDVVKVDDFKYLGSTVQSNGECGREVTKRVQAGWNGWRRMSGVICDRRVPARVKGKVCTVIVDSKTSNVVRVGDGGTDEKTGGGDGGGRVEDVTIFIRSDKNECIRGTAQVGQVGEKTREARLRWYGHERRKYDGYIGRRMLRMELP